MQWCSEPTAQPALPKSIPLCLTAALVASGTSNLARWPFRTVRDEATAPRTPARPTAATPGGGPSRHGGDGPPVPPRVDAIECAQRCAAFSTFTRWPMAGGEGLVCRPHGESHRPRAGCTAGSTASATARPRMRSHGPGRGRAKSASAFFSPLPNESQGPDRPLRATGRRTQCFVARHRVRTGERGHRDEVEGWAAPARIQ